MAFGIPTDQRSQIMLLLVAVAAFLIYLGWDGMGFYPFAHKVSAAKIDSARVEIDSLQRIVDAAKQDLASGSVEDLRRRVAEYSAALELMRRLVPEGSEVPALMDDISTKAKVRGVTLGKLQPLTPEPGQPFDTYRYRLEVYGHFDQIGEFLADVASLPRIVVPQELVLSPAKQQAQRLLGDTLGALLLAEFSIRTYVKSTTLPVAGKPAGGTTSARN